MVPSDAEFRRLVADEVRWHLLEELARSDRKVQELVASAGRPQNLVSYHLGRLRRAGLVTQHRSAADARDLYYQLDIERFTDLYSRAGAAVQPSFMLARTLMADVESLPAVRSESPIARWRVLFVCTANSARSQMAEAFTRELGNGRLRRLCQGQIEAESAGTAPRPVHPMASRVMSDLGVPMAQQRSKALEQVLDHRFDQVITLCDIAREVCLPVSGVPNAAHWSLPDPAEAAGPESEVYAAFKASALTIAARVQQMLVQVVAARNAPVGHAGT